jgi:hypothetical protein
MEASAPSQTEELASSVSVRRAGNVGASATAGNFAPTGWKKEEKFCMTIIHLDLLAP